MEGLPCSLVGLHMVKEAHHLIQHDTLDFFRLNAHQLFPQLKEILSALSIARTRNSDGRKMTGTLNDQSAAAGMPAKGGHQAQLLVDGRRDQIERSPQHHQRNC